VKKPRSLKNKKDNYLDFIGVKGKTKNTQQLEQE
jgi:hypothetical protein